MGTSGDPLLGSNMDARFAYRGDERGRQYLRNGTKASVSTASRICAPNWTSPCDRADVQQARQLHHRAVTDAGRAVPRADGAQVLSGAEATLGSRLAKCVGISTHGKVLDVLFNFSIRFLS